MQVEAGSSEWALGLYMADELQGKTKVVSCSTQATLGKKGLCSLKNFYEMRRKICESCLKYNGRAKIVQQLMCLLRFRADWILYGS